MELTGSLPKAKLAAENVTGVTPVPVKPTICGELDAVSLIVITPEMLPVILGVNVAVIVQVAPPPSALPHVLGVAPKSPLAAIEIGVD